MRDRLGQDGAFGLVSTRDRRAADLFYADLMGWRPRPRPREIEVWGEEDPAPTVKPTRGNPDEIVVTRANGTRYVVRRKVRALVAKHPGRPRLGYCRDDDRVFARLAWCQGTQATIDAGANVPAALRDLLNTVSGQISQGADPDQIRRTFENAPLQAFVELDITKVGSWKITGDLKIDMNSKGVLSTAAKLSGDVGWFSVGVEDKDDGSGKQVVATVDIPLGKDTVRGKKCPVQEVALWWEAECWREVPTKYRIPPPPGYRENEATLFLYFEHSTDLLRRDPRAKTESPDVIDEILASDPKLGTALLNKRTLERLDYLVEQGHFVDTINGYTSPEGRRGPPPPGSGSKWEGNEELARARARKVRTLVEARYVPGQLQMRKRKGPMRFPEGRSMPAGVGLSENPKLDERPGVELEGARLDRVLIHGDPKAEDKRPFLERFPTELARMTEEDLKYIGDSRLGDRKRAERLFENLRRVEIHLLQREPLRGAVVSGTRLEREAECPPDVMEAAARHWGSPIPFTKPDPPLCA